MNARPDSAQAAPDAQLPAEFRSALQLAQAAVWDWQLPGDRFQVDEAWLRAFGIEISSPTVAIREWQRRIHPDDLGAFNAAADSCQHGSDRFECEYRLLAAGHRWLWVLHRGRVVQRERDGAAARITGILLDIDRRKSEEVARSDSESRLATALWGARAAFWQWHVPSNARTASPLWLAMTGYSRAQWDAAPNPWFSNLHPEDCERVDRQLREHAQGTRDSVEFEYRFQTASGEYRWMQDRGRAVEWDLSGRPVLVIGVTLDIEAAKHAEAHLASSEHMLETAAWGAGIGLWETNFLTDTTRWFNDWCQRHDIDPCDGGEHVTRWDENLHPDEGAEATRRFYEHVNGKAEYYDAEYRIKSRSGTWRWVFERGRVVERDANGKAVRMLGVCMDLDEAKVAERQANARNERVEAALQLTTAGVWDWDVEHGITHNTDGYYRVFGVDPVFGRANHMNWRLLLGTDPELAIDNFRRRLQRVEAHEQVLETEYRFRHTDGSWHWALDRAYVVDRAPDGATRRVLGLVVDITERKIRETALTAADQRFRAVSSELRCVIYDIDAETGLTKDDGVERVLGYNSTELPSASDWAALVHPDDQHLLDQWFDRDAPSMAALQYRIRHRDGHYITLLDSPCAVRDASGKVVRIVGVAIDISEQARSQEALRSSQELLQMVATGTSDWLVLVDTRQRIQFINRDARGQPRESFIGRPLEDRYRMSRARAWLLAPWIPQPALWLVFDAPADVLRARQGEATDEDFDRLRSEYRRVLRGRRNVVLLDASQPIESVIADAERAIVAQAARRTARRLHLPIEQVDNPFSAEVLLAFSRRNVPILSRLVRVIFNSDINCRIPSDIHLPHPYGIVIQPQTALGHRVTMIQQATIGAKDPTDTSAPIIGDDVYIGAGARVLGDVRIGDRVVIERQMPLSHGMCRPAETVVGANRIIAGRLTLAAKRGSDGWVTVFRWASIGRSAEIHKNNA